MKTISVDEFQKQFSSMLETVKKGEPVEITSGANGTPVAVLMPAEQSPAQPTRKLGLLEGKAKVTIHDDWEMTDEEFLAS